MSNVISKMRMLSLAAISIGVSACATSIKSTVDTADNVDLGSFKTYAWVSDQPQTVNGSNAPGLINPVNHSRIRASIDEELQRKGYTRVPLAEADLAVAYTLGARDRVTVRNYYDDFGYRYYGYYNGFSPFYGPRFNRFGRGFGGFGPTTSTVHTFTEGTLVVDFFDNKRMEAIWHGSASKRLSNDESSRELVADAVGTLLGQFPDTGKMAEMMHEAMSGEATT